MKSENTSDTNQAKALNKTDVSGSVTQKVVVMEWGEPSVKNVIDVNYETQKVQVQSEGHAGSFWADFKDCMSQLKIDWFYIHKAASEVNRLQIKRTILESRSITGR